MHIKSIHPFFLRRAIVLLSVVIFLVVLFFAGYTKYHPQWGRLNVVVITVDTLRSDHLGSYGYDKIKTPHIDSLAKRGTLFETAISQAPLTLPSHASLFTSTYPPFHEIRDNGNARLHDSALTLAEIFRDRGYDTAAFVSTFVLNSRFGLSQGFHVYNDVNEDQDPNIIIKHMDGERTADKTTHAAIQWLKKKSPRPFFLWVHYYDPHSTYNPPQPFRQMYPDNPYDGEIAFTDHQIGRLLAYLRSVGLDERTLIVFASDHGEGLGEHNEPGHAVFVYDTVLKVPLIFSHPDIVPHGKRVPDQVRLVDVMPTILDFAKFPKPKTLQGESLARLIQGKVDSMDLGGAYAESFYAHNHYNWSPLVSYRTPQWKYIRSSKPELFDIVQDPKELVNLAQMRPDVIQNLDRELDTFLGQVISSDSKDTSVEMDEKTREKLMSLGYIQGDLSEEASSEPVPLEMIEVMEKINLNVRLANQGQMVEAVLGFKAILEKDPNNVEVYMHLGQCFREMKQYDKAIKYFKLAASYKPDETKVHDGLGNIYKSMGRVEEAFKEFKLAYELDPENPGILNNLGWYYQQKLQFKKALEYYDKTLAIDDTIATAHANRAICYRMVGNLPMAMKEIRRALELDSKLAFAHAELGALLAIRGNLKMAVRSCLRAIQINPKSVDGYNNLGVCYQRMGAYDRALESFMRAIELAPWNLMLYSSIGDAYQAKGEYDKAKEFYENALKINPKDRVALQKLQKLMNRKQV